MPSKAVTLIWNNGCWPESITCLFVDKVKVFRCSENVLSHTWSIFLLNLNVAHMEDFGVVYERLKVNRQPKTKFYHEILIWEFLSFNTTFTPSNSLPKLILKKNILRKPSGRILLSQLQQQTLNNIHIMKLKLVLTVTCR